MPHSLSAVYAIYGSGFPLPIQQRPQPLGYLPLLIE